MVMGLVKRAFEYGCCHSRLLAWPDGLLGAGIGSIRRACRTARRTDLSIRGAAGTARGSLPDGSACLAN
jgi:hypothetical protein